MQITVFSTQPHDRRFLDTANATRGHRIVFIEARLDAGSASLAGGSQAVCAFVNDRLDAATLEALRALGVRLVLLRSAGFNHVDLAAARRLGLVVARVPEYSPHAVAEHAVALLLALNRKIHRAYARVREGNFALDGLLGFDLHGSTVGVIGTGKIGGCFARIMQAFGCRVLAYDPSPDPALQAAGVVYAPIETLWSECDVLSLHCPLTPATHHLVNEASLARMKPEVLIVNTSRGGVVDTKALIGALKRKRVGGLALDVYEEEADLFFRDLSADVMQDDVFARLLTFPNVLITGHQGFFTHQALTAIATTTLDNAEAFERDGRPLHAVTLDLD